MSFIFRFWKEKCAIYIKMENKHIHLDLVEVLSLSLSFTHLLLKIPCSFHCNRSQGSVFYLICGFLFNQIASWKIGLNFSLNDALWIYLHTFYLVCLWYIFIVGFWYIMSWSYIFYQSIFQVPHAVFRIKISGTEWQQKTQSSSSS